MAYRTTVELVQKALGPNYNSSIDLDICIATANELVDRVAAVAGAKLNSSAATLMETWLACDAYVQIDPTYTSKSELGASGSFAKQDFRGMAERLDPTGTLKMIDTGVATATGVWLGRRPCRL